MSSLKLGLFLGGGVVRYGFGFRRARYASKTHSFGLAMERGAAAVRAELVHETWFVGGRAAARLLLLASGIEVLRFYGFGNETELQGDDQFHRVPQQQYVVAPSLSSRSVVAVSSARTRPRAHRYEARAQSAHQAQPLGTGKFGEVGLQADYTREGRIWSAWPRRGTVLNLGGSVYPGVVGCPRHVWRGSRSGGGVSWSLPVPLRPTLAIRAGAKSVWGAPIPRGRDYRQPAGARALQRALRG